MAEGKLPWDLKGYAETRLEKMNVAVLRDLCIERHIDIAQGANSGTCVARLLQWKTSQKPTRPAAQSAARPAADTELPWDLNGYGETRLEKLDGAVLRELCIERHIDITQRAQTNTCVRELLAWKERNGKHPMPTPPPSPALKSSASRPRAAPTRCTTFLSHEPNEWRTKLNGAIRDNVHGHRDVLQHAQRGNGAYTLRPLPPTNQEAPQVDHIFECQAMGDVLFRVDALRPVLRQFDWSARQFHQQPMVVQNGLKHARDVHNRVDFLALCGALVNKKKQGAFQRSLHTLATGTPLEHGLEHELRTNFARGEQPFGDDDAERMARTVANRLRDIEGPLADAMRDVDQGLAQGNDQQQRYDEIADEIVQLYEHFHLNRRV